MVVSLLMLLASAAKPHVAFLGHVRARAIHDAERHPENEPILGVLIFRVEAAALLYFGNVEYVQEVVQARIAATEDLRLVVCDPVERARMSTLPERPCLPSCMPI